MQWWLSNCVCQSKVAESRVCSILWDALLCRYMREYNLFSSSELKKWSVYETVRKCLFLALQFPLRIVSYIFLFSLGSSLSFINSVWKVSVDLVCKGFMRGDMKSPQYKDLSTSLTVASSAFSQNNKNRRVASPCVGSVASADKLGLTRPPRSCQPHQPAPVASSLGNHGDKAVAKRKCAEGQRQLRRTFKRAVGWEMQCPKCQQWHSPILWSVGGTYEPISMAQWCYLMHIPPLSQPPMWLSWIKSFRLKNEMAWNLFSDLYWGSWLGQDGHG